MSDALEKNVQAVDEIAGGRAVGDLARTARIGVWCDGRQSAAEASTRLTAEALGDLLGRFWRNIDVEGCASGELESAAVASADACCTDHMIRRRWNPPYDFAIGIGGAAPPGSAADTVAIGGAGWRVCAGSLAAEATGGGGLDSNPVGPLAAASLAAAEVLKSVLAVGEAGGAARIPAEYEWDVWRTCHPGAAAAPPGKTPLDIGEVHVFGVGAVTHALLWLLRRWPGGAVGTLHLVDPDRYDGGNAHRYIDTVPGDIGRPKASSAAEGLRRRCSGLDVVAHVTDMNAYFTEDSPDCRVRTAVCGLDSEEGRRQLGLKIPLEIVNMWTSGFHAGASAFSLGDSAWPCIHCAYPDPPGASIDEASAVHGELGLLPRRARELLESGLSIDEADAQTIALATGASAGDIPLKPLRSVRTEMCATGRIAIRGGRRGADADADVPLAFASAMAGVAGFAELVRSVRGGAGRIPGQFQVPVLKYPLPGSWTGRRRNPACRHCSDAVRMLAAAKYGQPAAGVSARRPRPRQAAAHAGDRGAARPRP